MRYCRTIFVLGLSLLILGLGVALAPAQPATENGPRLTAEQQRKLESWKARLDDVLKAEQSVLRQVYVIEAEQHRQQQELDKIIDMLDQVRNRSEAAETELNTLTADHLKRTGRVKKTMRGMYKLGRGGMWRVLFESKDVKTFLIRYKALRSFLLGEAKQMRAYRDKAENLSQKRRELAEDIETLTELKADAESRREAVWLEQQKRITLLDQIQRNKALALRVTRELQEQDKALADKMREMGENPPVRAVLPESLVLDFTRRKGYLRIPVKGAIVGHFGKQTERRFGTVTRNNGIDISAAEGAEVTAVADGTVVYIGDFLGYGRVLIIDHGDRYHTMYAHLDRFFVSKGDALKAGTVIGTVGRTGSLDGAQLHFELRHKGQAQDPLDWFEIGGN